MHAPCARLVTGDQAMLAQRQGDVVINGQREGVGLLEDVPDPPPQLLAAEGAAPRSGHAAQADGTLAAAAGSELVQAVERTQQRRLSRARGADQRENLALYTSNDTFRTAARRP